MRNFFSRLFAKKYIQITVKKSWMQDGEQQETPTPTTGIIPAGAQGITVKVFCPEGVKPSDVQIVISWKEGQEIKEYDDF